MSYYEQQILDRAKTMKKTVDEIYDQHDCKAEDGCEVCSALLNEPTDTNPDDERDFLATAKDIDLFPNSYGAR